jgi:N,N-dimethylformamidase
VSEVAELKEAEIWGYADRLSVAPGETIEFKVSCAHEGTYRADIVRLVNGDTTPRASRRCITGAGTRSR